MEPSAKELVRLRLDVIAAQSDGLLTPEAVVKDARNPKSPLHEHFEWNVNKAAMSHWLDTARSLIRSVKVTVVTETAVLSTVAYIRDPSLGGDEQGYRSITSFKTEREKAREAVVGEFDRAASVLRRARDIAEALDLADDVESILADVGIVRERARVG